MLKINLVVVFFFLNTVTEEVTVSWRISKHKKSTAGHIAHEHNDELVLAINRLVPGVFVAPGQTAH